MEGGGRGYEMRGGHLWWKGIRVKGRRLRRRWGWMEEGGVDDDLGVIEEDRSGYGFIFVFHVKHIDDRRRYGHWKEWYFTHE